MLRARAVYHCVYARKARRQRTLCFYGICIFSHVYFTSLIYANSKNVHWKPVVSIAPSTTPSSFLQHCIILTQDTALKPTRINADLACTPFLAEPFSEEQFLSASAQAQAKIRQPWLQHSAGDLTNNASVNIYVNHMRMWQRVIALKAGPVLVLEDDCVPDGGFETTINALLQYFNQTGARNYVIKLQGNGPHDWQYLEWEKVLRVGKHVVKQCTCRPHHTSSSSAAYVLDEEAARNLLLHALPIRRHVDVYKHALGCIDSKINLYAMRPNIATAHHTRASSHFKRSDVWHRIYLLAVELLDDLRDGQCSISNGLLY